MEVNGSGSKLGKATYSSHLKNTYQGLGIVEVFFSSKGRKVLNTRLKNPFIIRREGRT
jgi:hypothetical protein